MRCNRAVIRIFIIATQEIALLLMDPPPFYRACFHWQENRFPALYMVIRPESVGFSEHRSLTAIFDGYSGDAVRSLHMVNIGKCLFIVLGVQRLIKIIPRVAFLMSKVAACNWVGVCEKKRLALLRLY